MPSCIDARARDALASRSFSNTFTSEAIDACIQVTLDAAGANKKGRRISLGILFPTAAAVAVGEPANAACFGRGLCVASSY